MSMSTYNLLKKHFMPELSMSSIFILQARISKLSHVTEVSYDCCLNTCCCFTRTYAALNSCPFCKHAWYNLEGHSYKKYKYLPIEPRIKSLFPETAKLKTSLMGYTIKCYVRHKS